MATGPSRWRAAAFLCAASSLVLAACGARTGALDGPGTSAVAAAADAVFAGTYDCTGVCGSGCSTTTTFTITQSPGELTLSFGGVQPCALTYTPSGNGASLRPGQTCTAQETIYTYTEGDLRLTGAELQMHEAYTRTNFDGSSGGAGTDDQTCTRRGDAGH